MCEAAIEILINALFSMVPTVSGQRVIKLPDDLSYLDELDNVDITTKSISANKETFKSHPHTNNLFRSVPVQFLRVANAVLVFVGFYGALILGYFLYYEKIVKNAFYGYPIEWMPSVSATIGDYYPSRHIFQITMALTALPRLAMLWISMKTQKWSHPRLLFAIGFTRAFFSGLFIYFPSGESSRLHEASMILYLGFTLLYHCLAWPYHRSKTNKISLATLCIAIATMIHLYIQHKVHRIPGEWSLIAIDIVLDYSSTPIQSDVHKNKPSIDHIVHQETPSWLLWTDADRFVSLSSRYRELSELFFGFLFWTITSSFTMTMWYFPLWALRFSGAEISLLLFFMPALLGSDTISHFSNTYQLPLWALSLATTLLYPSARFQSVSVRFVILSMGTGLFLTMYFQRWFSAATHSFSLRNLLGLGMSLIVRFAFCSHNPAWTTMPSESGGIHVLTFLASLFFLGGFINNTHKRINSNKLWSLNGIISAIGFGSLFFLLWTFYSESTLLLRWIGHGYPNNGPSPFLAGLLTISVFILSTFLNTPLNSPLKRAVLGSAALICFYVLAPIVPNAALFCGLVSLFFMLPLWIPFSIPPSTLNIGTWVSVSTATLFTLFFLHLYTVAYAFVPLGWLLRERPGTVISIACFLIVFASSKMPVEKFDTGRRYFNLIVLALALGLAIQTRLLYPYYQDHDQKVIDIESNPLISETITNAVKEAGGLKLFTAGIWTIHFGLDMDMMVSHGRMENLIRDADLDIVGLLESDTMRIVTGNRDVPQMLGESLNMYVDYGPSTRNSTWGCAMLSKFPIVSSTHHLLPSPGGELACAIHATVKIGSFLVDVLVSHNGQEEDVLDRFLQTTEIARIIRSSKNPTVFLGYVVTKPQKGNYHILMKKDRIPAEDIGVWSPTHEEYLETPGAVYDIDSIDWDRWCQYIGYKGPSLTKISYCRITHAHISDTELQAATFGLYKSGAEQAVKELKQKMSEINAKGQFEYSSPFYRKWKFNPGFYKRKEGGIRGHSFHVVKHFWAIK